MSLIQTIRRENFNHDFQLDILEHHLTTRTFADVDVIAINNDSRIEHSVRCHRIILASISHFLKGLLEEYSDTLVLENTSRADLDNLVSLAYTGSVTLQSVSEQDSLTVLMDRLGVDKSKVSVVSSTLNNNNNNNDLVSSLDTMLENTNDVILCDYDWESFLLMDGFASTVDKSAIVYNFDCFNSNSNTSDSSTSSGFSDPSNVSSDDGLKDNSKFRCSICAKLFHTRRYLRFHEKNVHYKKKSFVCDVCGKTFSGSYYLRQHDRRMHSANRRFGCEKCPAAFGVKYDLVVHQRTHDTVKPFACDICGKTYATGRAAREHARTHTGERPFKCPECPKRFALQKTLRVHYRQHSGERPYLCSHCGRTFVQNSTLNNHLRHHHGHKKSNNNNSNNNAIPISALS